MRFSSATGMSFTGVLIGILLSVSGCGESQSPPPSSDNPTVPTGQLPGTIPSPGPSDSPTPGADREWGFVSLFKDCHYPECPARDGFSVLPTGVFSYGSGETGELMPEDLTELGLLVREVLDQDLSPPPTCTSLPPLVGRSSMTVDLVDSWGVFHRIYDLKDSENSLCRLGDLGPAEDLTQALDFLASDSTLGIHHSEDILTPSSL